MPSSITQAIYDGKDVSLGDFAFRTVRTLDYFIHMREWSSDAKLRPRGRLEEAQERLQKALDYYFELITRPLEKWQEDFDVVNSQRKQAEVDVVEHRAVLTSRYDEMIEKVEAWDAPEALIPLKRQMRRYLEESKDYDIRPSVPANKEMDLGQYKSIALDMASRAIESARLSVELELDADKKTNEVIKAFADEFGEEYIAT